MLIMLPLSDFPDDCIPLQINSLCHLDLFISMVYLYGVELALPQLRLLFPKWWYETFPNIFPSLVDVSVSVSYHMVFCVKHSTSTPAACVVLELHPIALIGS